MRFYLLEQLLHFGLLPLFLSLVGVNFQSIKVGLTSTWGRERETTLLNQGTLKHRILSLRLQNDNYYIILLMDRVECMHTVEDVETSTSKTSSQVHKCKCLHRCRPTYPQSNNTTHVQINLYNLLNWIEINLVHSLNHTHMHVPHTHTHTHTKYDLDNRRVIPTCSHCISCSTCAIYKPTPTTCGHGVLSSSNRREREHSSH